MSALKPCPNPACGSECVDDDPTHEMRLRLAARRRAATGQPPKQAGDLPQPDLMCMTCGFSTDGAKWNAMLRPADIVAARIEGLSEAQDIAAQYYVGFTDDETGADAWSFDKATFDKDVDARIAELEATAPEASDTRAKAEAFDAFLEKVRKCNETGGPNGTGAFFPAEPLDMTECLAEAKRKGAGT